MGVEVGGREGGDKEVQTNKHSNPKSASARSARPEVVRADAPGGTGRRGRAAERGWGDAAGGRAPASDWQRRALALRAKVSAPRGCRVDSLSYLFIYLFSRSLARSLPALLSTPFSRPHSRLPLTPAFTPRPHKAWGGKEVALEFRGLREGDRG